ncbi:MAG: 50S ribosomal protein L21 [Bdellovibrionaceae bacterium]|nr:50S ribosomal protein L21 [Pseudobdellovibrionaceae bacterium]
MYAIVKTGGKQYRVQAGETVRVEKLSKDLGEEFDLTDVLVVGGDKTFIGEPTVDNAKVRVVVTNQAKAPKVIVFKKKRRQGYRKMQGHRQLFTELFVKSISTPDGETVSADADAKVFDPEKRLALLEAREAERLATRKEKATEKKQASTVERKKATTKKKAAKKAVKKKVAKKTAKKKVAKKKTAAKKTTKKAAAKKTTKKKS